MSSIPTAVSISNVPSSNPQMAIPTATIAQIHPAPFGYSESSYPIATMIYSSPGPTDGIPQNDRMVTTWKLSRIIRFLSGLDGLICLMYGLQNAFFLLLGILPLLGWQGARHYKICEIYGYGVFTIFMASMRVYATTLVPSTLNIIFGVVSVMVEIWILRVLLFFIRQMRSLTEDELRTLRLPYWQPVLSHV